jgi:hypothetical protein
MVMRTKALFVRPVMLAAVVLLLPICAAVAAAPAGAATWQTGYSFDDRADSFLDVATGPGGAVYCVGYTRGTEESSLLLVAKYVDSGATVDLAWTRTFRKTGRPGSVATDVAVDRDGNVVVAGVVGTSPSVRKTDIVVLKYSPAGVRRWRTYYNGPADREDAVTGLGLDRNGNAYVSGDSRGVGTNLDFVTVKVRRNGGRAWAKRYAGPAGRDTTAGIAVTKAGDSYVTGASKRASGGIDGAAVTIKYSSAGVQRWRKTFSTDIGRVLVGGIGLSGSRAVIVGGNMWNGNLEGSDQVFLKYRTSDGKRLWKRFLGNGDAFNESVADIDTDGAGSVYAAGTTEDENFSIDHGFLSSLDAAGGSGWSDVLWEALAQDSQFQSVSAGLAGECAGGGWGDSVIAGKEFVVRYVYRGGPAIAWTFVTAGSAIGDDICRSVLAHGGVAYAAGELHNAGSGTDAARFKLGDI